MIPALLKKCGARLLLPVRLFSSARDLPAEKEHFNVGTIGKTHVALVGHQKHGKSTLVSAIVQYLAKHGIKESI